MIRVIWNFAKDNRHQIAKYATVGTIAAIIDFGVLFLLTDEFGLYYLASATCSFILAAIVNFILNRNWTFQSNGQKRKQFPVFLMVATSGLLINVNIMYFSVERLGMYYLMAKVLSSGIVIMWNFFGNKFITFKIE